MKTKTLVFTGGHHTGALVVARILASKGWQVIWFGHRHSLWGQASDSAEYREVTAAGLTFYDLQAGKFYRTTNPLKLIRLPWGFIQALYWLVRIRPAGIVSFGGYLAVPTVISGWILGIPSITHEQTVTIGWANKLISFFVRRIALTWPESAKYYPASKIVLTGLPLRPEILQIKAVSVLPKTVYITGGKNGSRFINRVVFKSLPLLIRKYSVIHQTGYLDYSSSQTRKGPKYESFSFNSTRAVAALAEAGVVVSRAGAHIIYELALLGKKCVLVPIPGSSHHEQDQNAALLEANHLAVVLPQDRLNTNSLLTAVSSAFKLRGIPLPLPTDGSARLVQLIENVFSG